jgi:hypothetical protein
LFSEFLEGIPAGRKDLREWETKIFVAFSLMISPRRLHPLSPWHGNSG